MFRCVNPPAGLLLVATVMLLASSAPADQPDFDRLPAGWSLERHDVVPADQAAAIGRRLGGEVVGLKTAC